MINLELKKDLLEKTEAYLKTKWTGYPEVIAFSMDQ